MNISDLNKIDIKNIDLMKLKDQLLGRKDLLIQIGICFVTFMLIVSSLNKSQSELRDIKSKMATLKAKTSSIDDYNNSSKDMNQFLKKIPPSLSEGQVVDRVTDLAVKHHIKIMSVNPLDSKDEESSTKLTLLFLLQASDYAEMVRLIHGIEQSENLLQIKSCSAQPQVGTDPITKKSDSPLISFRIEVASVQPKI